MVIPADVLLDILLLFTGTEMNGSAATSLASFGGLARSSLGR
jgi:hypothetical protein